MIDQTTRRGRLLGAALACAAHKPWGEVTLVEIAEAANVPFAEVRGDFGSKSDILTALLRAVDDEVLKRRPQRDPGQASRDVLFDVIMTRFDVLAPYKPALKSIYASGAADFSLAQPFLASQHWMLQAAGIGTDGLVGGLRIAGLAVTYASVFRTWLGDDDPGLARTMAALDRRLRRSERTLSGLQQAGSAASRFATAMQEALRSATRPRTETRTEPDAEPRPGPHTP